MDVSLPVVLSAESQEKLMPEIAVRIEDGLIGASVRFDGSSGEFLTRTIPPWLAWNTAKLDLWRTDFSQRLKKIAGTLDIANTLEKFVAGAPEALTVISG